MATVEKPQNQQQQLPVQQDDYSSGEDYDSADEYEYSDDENDDVPQKQLPRRRRRRELQRQQQQKQNGDDDYYSDDDSDSEDYDDDYSDDDVTQGKAMQPYEKRRMDLERPGGMNVVQQEKKSIDDKEGMKLKLELNLEIEIELKATIHGDLTLALM